MSYKFDFGPEGVTVEGYHKVTNSTLYEENLAYGFTTINKVSAKKRTNESLTGDFCIPFDSTFVADVPNGNYIVTITLGDAFAPTHTSLKTNGEHLVLQNYETVSGQIAREQFGVNVRNGQLKLSFGGLAPRLNSVEMLQTSQQITIYLAGDSTVTDPSEDGFPFSGWGQMLNYYFKHDVVIANHAIGGRSSKSFISEGRLEGILEEIKEGDYLFIQFGHNDQKSDEERFTDPDTTYPEHLKKYIDAARSKKATPVLITSVHRRYYDNDGHIINMHTTYLDAVRKLAEEENVALIDLADRSKQLFEELGEEATKSIFLWGEPGEWRNSSNGIKDNTHFQEQGSLQIAELVVQGIRDLNLMRLTMFLKPTE
ncbi:rhamnogalacturonan acetylesterase [Paenibacillus endoradicis]|uniref:rhamnogalacturonan acetylesterase n=1 Tax=Paenibacillus endoradicis TaxID=2972487 RepID=UPI002159056E|nr:GDSL-type esterase/lipase family protein [Paenibacillus endoradicis]MCR8660593.1 GDSL-type esterase/lipase family protein [Paenibacillus endoradicis]